MYQKVFSKSLVLN